MNYDYPFIQNAELFNKMLQNNDILSKIEPSSTNSNENKSTLINLNPNILMRNILINPFSYNSAFNPYNSNQRPDIYFLNNLYLYEYYMKQYNEFIAKLRFSKQIDKENSFNNQKRLLEVHDSSISIISSNKNSNKRTERSVKNNKLVYIQSNINLIRKKKIKKIQFPKALKKKSYHDKVSPKSRGSIYRGVSRNGNQWQVLIMINKTKRYIGSFSSEEEASRAYDTVSLKYHGNKAKTNHPYTEEEISNIINSTSRYSKDFTK